MSAANRAALYRRMLAPDDADLRRLAHRHAGESAQSLAGALIAAGFEVEADQADDERAYVWRAGDQTILANILGRREAYLVRA